MREALGEFIVEVPPDATKELDYALYDALKQKVLIELKEVPHDLLASLRDGRIFRQRTILAEHDGPSFFLFEGYPQITRDGLIRDGTRASGFTYIAFIGFCLSLHRRGIGILWSPGLDMTPQVLKECYNNLNKAKHHEYRIGPGYSWGRPSKGEWIRYHYQGLPGIGPEAASHLADNFPSPLDLCAADIEDLEQVPLIGPKRANIIWKCMRGLWP